MSLLSSRKYDSVFAFLSVYNAHSSLKNSYVVSPLCFLHLHTISALRYQTPFFFSSRQSLFPEINTLRKLSSRVNHGMALESLLMFGLSSRIYDPRITAFSPSNGALSEVIYRTLNVYSSRYLDRVENLTSRSFSHIKIQSQEDIF